ncbi:MAG: AI-2E family transporter [Thermoanaerobaculia bacterium]
MPKTPPESVRIDVRPVDGVLPAVQAATTPTISRSEIAAWILMGAAILLVFYRHLVPAVVVGLAFYILLDKISAFFRSRFRGRAAGAIRPLALFSATVIGSAIVTAATALVVGVFRTQIKNIPRLMGAMADIIESTRLWLVGFGGYEMFPEAVQDAEDFKKIIVEWLKSHSNVIGIAGETFTLGTMHAIMALLLAAMVFLRHVPANGEASGTRFSSLLLEKIKRFTEAFARVVSAQLKISTINTLLTAVYLLVLLPAFHSRLPFSGTIVLITFVCGLIPVVGNLISNTVIVIVSFGISPGTAVSSLVFLVLIHKLEYVVNSRIVGSKTGSQMWEILLALFAGQVAFGLQGLVLGPIIYTFVKRELQSHRVL